MKALRRVTAPLLSFAATGGSDIEIAKILLATGADRGSKSAKEDDSYAALHYAAETGNLKLAELLIAEKVDVNCRDPEDSALHFAIVSERLEILRLLIAHGADVNTVTGEVSALCLWPEQNNCLPGIGQIHLRLLLEF